MSNDPNFTGLTSYVAWFGRDAKAGTCMGCQLARPIYRGYNGGQPMGVTMCSTCKPKFLRWCQEQRLRGRR